MGEATAAATAWSRLDRGAPPSAVEPLRYDRHGNSTARLFRLVGAGTGGENVIAKRAPRETGALEDRLYGDILPRLPLPRPRYYGLRPADEEAWIFLEEVAGRPWDRERPEDRRLAGEWLGVLHSRTADLEPPPGLPRRDLADYRAMLHAGRADLLRQIARPDGDADGLQRTARALDGLESRWGEIERRWAVLPPSVVHGDFIGKNVFVDDAAEPPALLAVDWGRAGWGVGAEDAADIDVDAYLAAWRESDPEFPAEAAREMVALGRTLQAVAWIRSWSVGLSQGWGDPAARALADCGLRLERAREAADLA